MSFLNSSESVRLKLARAKLLAGGWPKLPSQVGGG